MVDEHHANEDNEHAEALEGKHGHAKSAVLSCHAGGVVLTVGAALLARQAVAGGPLVCVGAAVCSFSLPPHPCQRQEYGVNKVFNSKGSRREDPRAWHSILLSLVRINKLIHLSFRVFLRLLGAHVEKLSKSEKADTSKKVNKKKKKKGMVKRES